ncbi:MAG TPA: DciA family protein [Woeseiaceae bacterium]|nr:DciA family protein [Woeseiaceae bacterium]
MALTRLEKLLQAPGGSPLRKVIRRAQEMDGLAARLRAALDPEAAPHLVAANLREDGELAIVCSSPAWAARLRFESDTLLRAARSAGAPAERVSIRVARGQE